MAEQASIKSTANDREELAPLCSTLQWVETQRLQLDAAVRKATSTSSPSKDLNTLLERIDELQKELLEVSTERSIQDLMVHRLQLGSALIKNLFPPSSAGGDAGDTESTISLLPLVRKQTELCSAILSVHKEMKPMRISLEEARKDNYELEKRNRELMATLKERNENQQKRQESVENTEKVKRLREQLDELRSKVIVQRHVFQGLILGSRINWAQDPDMQELVVSLGLPFD